MAQFDHTTTGDVVVKTFAKEAGGKTVLITGPSDGSIGGQTALFFAAGKPKMLLLAGRNLTKVQPVMDQIKKAHPEVAVVFIKLDLATQASIRQAAKEVLSIVDKLDILINNAGVMAVTPYTTTAEGIELQFGANHIGHFLLTNLLVPKMGHGSRIINVSSLGYVSSGVRYDDWNFNEGKDYNEWVAYAASKTANILFASSLADKLKHKGILALSLNPGLVTESKLMTAVTPEMFGEGHRIATEALAGDEMPGGALQPVPLSVGASTTLYASLDPSLASHPGAFLNRCQVFKEPLRPFATGQEKKDKLWALSEKLVGEKFAF